MKMNQRISVVLLCLTLISALTACNLADMEFGGLVGELFGDGPHNVLPPAEPQPEIRTDAWFDPNGVDVLPEIEDALPVKLNLDCDSIVIYETQGASQLKDTQAQIVRESQLTMEEQFYYMYGIGMEHRIDDATTVFNHVTRDAKAGLNTFYMCYLPLSQIAQISTSGLFYSNQALPGLDMNNGCWYQGFNKDLRIGERQYAFAGALTPYVQLNADCLVYNRDMMSEIGVDVNEYFYNGEWTLEMLGKLSEMAFADLNGDGRMSEYDRYGVAYQTNSRADHLLYGSGVDMFENGVLLYSEDTYTDINNLLAPVWTCTYEGDQAEKMFMDGRSLFYATTLSDYAGLDGEDAMATYAAFTACVAPTPSYEVAGTYASHVNSDTPVLAVPNCPVGEVDIALDVMAVLASQYYSPAIEGWMYKVNPTSESADMAQRIMDNVSCDVDRIMVEAVGGYACNPLANRTPTVFFQQTSKLFEKQLREIYDQLS